MNEIVYWNEINSVFVLKINLLFIFVIYNIINVNLIVFKYSRGFFMVDIINEFFLKPIFQGGGYNPINTLFFAAILIAVVFTVFKVLSKLNIKIDDKFFYYLLPFIFFGSVMRSLVDISEKALRYGEVPIIPVDVAWVVLLLKTPGIYIFVFAIVAFLLLFQKLLHSKGIAKNLG